VNLITIKRRHIIQDEETGEQIIKERIYGVPTSSTLIEENDVLILLGKDRDLKKLIE